MRTQCQLHNGVHCNVNLVFELSLWLLCHSVLLRMVLNTYHYTVTLHLLLQESRRDDDVVPYLVHAVKGTLKALNLNLYILPACAEY